MLLSTMQNQKKILVVDDTPVNLQLVLEYLNDSDYKVSIAQSGKEALEIAELINPDLILLDVVMSEVDGFATCRQLKANIKTKDIPIIFMTALVETNHQLYGLSLGAVDYITKPINPEELLARINIHLTIQNLTNRLDFEQKQQQVLFDVIERIGHSLDFESMFRLIIEDICSFLQCDRFSLVSITNENITIESQAIAAQVKGENLNQITLEVFCSSLQDCKLYHGNEIKIVENSNNLPASNSSLTIKEIQMQSQLIVPILLDKNTPQANKYHPLWGWLLAEQCTFRQWQEQELIFLKRLTTQLSIAIDQGLLQRQLHNSQQQIQKTRQNLQELAFHDSLTQVFNRRYFDQQLNLEWNRLKRIPSPLSIILCDIDCFKIYNDTYGHQQGDQCLQKVAQAIARAVKRPADVIARYGGEEFVAILPYTPRKGAIKVAENIRIAVKKLNIPHPNSTVNSVVTISAGVATTIPESEDKPTMLIEAADQALYKAKNRGRDCLAVYQKPISQSKSQQQYELQWSKRIRYALKENLFRLYAQPITSLRDNNSTQRFEILLRLQDREDKVISPHMFLDVAERNSLMPSIDTWVINRLFEKLSCQGDNYYWRNYQFSINLSGASLNDETFLDFLSHKLTNCDFPPQMFCFEITEAVAVSNIDKINQFIVSLKDLGCSFALDDFGKGMSSLTYLKNLPVDYLKIDGSFITELNKDKVSKVMVEAINHLAVGIGLKTVAEFVENEAILDTLRHLKIDFAQGYHLGRPQKFADIL